MLTGIGYFGLVISVFYCAAYFRESIPAKQLYKLQVAVWSGIIGSTSFVLLSILKG